MNKLYNTVIFGEDVLLAYPPQDRGTSVNEADEADDSKWDKFRIKPQSDSDSPE